MTTDMGHSRRFRAAPEESGSPPITDIRRQRLKRQASLRSVATVTADHRPDAPKCKARSPAQSSARHMHGRHVAAFSARPAFSAQLRVSRSAYPGAGGMSASGMLAPHLVGSRDRMGHVVWPDRSRDFSNHETERAIRYLFFSILYLNSINCRAKGGPRWELSQLA
jgi:hypothetical protein